MLKTTKLKFEKPVRLTAFQKLQSVQSIAIFFKFVRPSLPFLYLLHCRRFCLITQHRQKRIRGRLSYNMPLKTFWQDLSNFNWIMFCHFVKRMCYQRYLSRKSHTFTASSIRFNGESIGTSTIVGSRCIDTDLLAVLCLTFVDV